MTEHGEDAAYGPRGRRPFRTLSQELEELERTDPAVAEAARKYDETVRRILRRRPEGETP